MGRGRISASIIKNISKPKPRPSTTLQDLKNRANSLGYRIGGSDDRVDKHKAKVNVYLDELQKFQEAFNETPDMIKNAGGTLTILPQSFFSGPDVAGSSGTDGSIKLSEYHIANSHSQMLDTLPHEHTHNLVHTVITKELGYKPGTPDYHNAYIKGTAEHAINTEALEKYRDYIIRQAHKNFPDDSGMNAKFRESALTRANNMTIEQASKDSGMRSYALRQYNRGEPMGHYVEMPTVATEMFQQNKYNWGSLLKNSPYSYFVLQTLYHKLHKK